MSSFVSNYFIVYPTQQQLYSTLNAVSIFVGSLLANIITAIVVGLFEGSPMAKPIICMLKAFIDLPCCAMIFL